MIQMRPKVLLNYEDVLNTYKLKERGIKALKVYLHWFPLEPSPRLAGIVGDLMGDGHLQDKPHWRIDYTSNSIDELNRFNNEIFQLFRLRGKIRDCTTNKYGTMNLGVNTKPLGRVLKLIGVPTGSKVLSKFSVPNWILSDKDLFSRFANRLFSCEGCVDVPSRGIELKMYKSLELIEDGMGFFEQLSYHLNKYFNIRTTKPFLEGRTTTRKDGIKTKGIRIKLKNKESLKNFRDHVGFEEQSKAEKLNKIFN